MIPRIRGKIGVCEEPAEYAGKFFFTLWMTEIGGGEGKCLGEFGPYETHDIASVELNRSAKLACDAIELELTGSISGKYLDLKTNKLREWNDRNPFA